MSCTYNPDGSIRHCTDINTRLAKIDDLFTLHVESPDDELRRALNIELPANATVQPSSHRDPLIIDGLTKAQATDLAAKLSSQAPREKIENLVEGLQSHAAPVTLPLE